MKDRYTTFLSDEVFKQLFERYVNSYLKASRESEGRLAKGVQDPITLLAKAAALKLSDVNSLLSMEKDRIADKALTNNTGLFHQSILGSVSGWENHDSGFDIVSEERKILAEIKNKHNTMNKDNKDKVIADLQEAIRQRKKGWVGYLVVIIPKTSQPFTTPIGRNIFEIDGQSFYEIVTGRSDALRQVYEAIPKVVSDLGMICAPEIIGYCDDLFVKAYGEKESSR